jgi:hypothetical protein
LTVLREGGHIAELLHKPTGINPLWTPPWPSIEPSAYRPELHPEYGLNAESELLAGIMGHNLCLDIFGPPSEEEAAAGMTVHGEASVMPYIIRVDGAGIVASIHLRSAQLDFERRLALAGDTVRITETVHNCGSLDRPIAWTQHVTLGPPFIVPGETQFAISATRSKTFEGDLGDLFPRGVEFDWPYAPLAGGGTLDLRTYTNAPVSAGYTSHLLDPAREDAYFSAWSPATKVLVGYRWNRANFPWIGIWEENHSRQSPPWNGRTLTRGMEFGVSPMPETRRAMIERGSMFGVPAFAWVPARKSIRAEYSAFVRCADQLDVSA